MSFKWFVSYLIGWVIGILILWVVLYLIYRSKD